MSHNCLNIFSMNTYVLLHFEHINDVTIIVKPLYTGISSDVQPIATSVGNNVDFKTDDEKLSPCKTNYTFDVNLR